MDPLSPSSEQPTPAGTTRSAPPRGSQLATGPFLPTPAPYSEARPTVPEGSASTSEATPIFEVMGPYQLLGELGRGGMGIVYKARHATLDRVVALKTMRADLVADADRAQRFDREMQAAARLDHPHVVPIYEVGRHGNRPYYTMPYLTGGSLSGLRQRLSSDPRAALALVEKIARAVQYAHERGVVHRDLKPANVLLDERGEPQVSDFGLAKLHDSDVDLTETGAVLGTPSYMAPEQAAGQTKQIGPQTDVWALGVILYELLTGRRPFVGESGEEVKHKIRTEEPPPPLTVRPELDPVLESILLACLRKQPERRYATAGALADDLGRYLRGGRWREPWQQRLKRRLLRHPYRNSAVALAMVMAVALTALGISQEPRHTDPIPQVVPDPPLTLLGESGPPERLHWVLGEKEAAISSAPNEPFSFSASNLCLLELRDTVPWPHYELKMRVRHESATEGGVGFFFAYNAHPFAGGLYHSYWEAGFADYGAAAGAASLAVVRVQDALPHDSTSLPVSTPGKYLTPAARTGKPSPWRTLIVRVTGEGVSAMLDDKEFGKGPTDLVQKYSINIFAEFRDIHGAFTPRSALGIFLQNGKAAFQGVVVRPLP